MKKSEKGGKGGKKLNTFSEFEVEVLHNDDKADWSFVHLTIELTSNGASLIIFIQGLTSTALMLEKVAC